MDRAQIAALISKNGLRPTAQRVAVYEYLLRRTHPSVDEVFTAVSRDDPSLSRTTVYNSLHALVEAGLVLELSLAGTQERHYDADTSLHAHLLCLSCRRIFDVPVAHAAAKVLQPEGFTVRTTEIGFTGYCPHCGEN